MKQILIVEDDITLNKLLANLLTSDGYSVDTAFTAKDANKCIDGNHYDLIILDINLPDGSGYEICKSIKEKSCAAVIFLTANDLEQDMIKGYQTGAADYITKPFSNHILRCKVKAIFMILDHSDRLPDHMIYDDGYFFIDFSALNARLGKEEISFSPLEYRMLEVFIKNKGILLTRQRLFEILWDSQDNYVDEHTLTATISRIRGKIEKNGRKYIKTVYGMGYMFLDGGTV